MVVVGTNKTASRRLIVNCLCVLTHFIYRGHDMLRVIRTGEIGLSWTIEGPSKQIIQTVEFCTVTISMSLLSCQRLRYPGVPSIGQMKSRRQLYIILSTFQRPQYLFQHDPIPSKNIRVIFIFTSKRFWKWKNLHKITHPANLYPGQLYQTLTQKQNLQPTIAPHPDITPNSQCLPL